MFEIPDDDFEWEDSPLENMDVVVNGPAGLAETLSENLKSTTVRNSTVLKTATHNNFGHEIFEKDQSLSIGTGTSDKVISKILSKRKFPGPAGILPPSTPSTPTGTVDIADVKGSSTAVDTPDLKVCSIPLSQAPTDDIFSSPMWKALISDINASTDMNMLSKFSIKATLFKASRKLLHRGKVPLIIGVIDNLDMHGADASFVIRDPTGKMKGALHQDLIKDRTSALQSGSVIVLRQVSVISPSTRTHYLNVTPGNVVFIYSASKDAEVTKWSWFASQLSLAEVNSYPENSLNMPSLKHIIEESERELAASLRNFRHRRISDRLQTSTPSPFSRRPGQSNIFSAPSKLPSTNTNFNSPLLPFPNSSCMSTPVSISASSKASIMAPRGRLFTQSPAMSQQNSNSFTRNAIPSFPVRTVNCAGADSRWVPAISGAKAVRDSSFDVGSNQRALVSGPSGSMSGNLLQEGSLNKRDAATNSDMDKTGSRKRCLSIENRSDVDADAFPDDEDDQIIAQLCDENLDPPHDGEYVISNGNSAKAYIRDDSFMKNASVKGSEVGKQHEEDKKENRTLNFVPYKSESCLRETTGTKSILGVNPQITDYNLSPLLSAGPMQTSQSSESRSKFSFKRSEPSHSAHYEVPTKKPVLQRDHQTTLSVNSECHDHNANTHASRFKNNNTTSLVGVKPLQSDSRNQFWSCALGVPVSSEDGPVIKKPQIQWDADLDDDSLLSQLCEDF